MMAGVVAAAGIIAVGAQQAGQVVAPGLVMGRVVDRDDDAPIGGALVETAPLTDGAPAEARVTQLTDSDGRFVFRGLPAGAYEIRVSTGGTGFSPAGYIQSGLGAPIGAYLPGGPGQRRPGGPVEPLSLAPGQTVPDLLVRLWKGAAIGGTVRDELGDPLVDAVVGAVQLANDGAWLSGPTTRTDDLGRYRLSALLPGRYVVFVPQVTLGRVANAELPGIAVGDATVSASVRDSANNYLAPARAGAALRVFRTTFHPDATTAGAAAVVSLGAGDDVAAVDVTLTPVPAVPVSGVVSRAGGGVGGVEVRLFPAGAGGEATGILETAMSVTDGLGRFVFPLVPAGRYVVRATLAGREAPAGARAALPPGAWMYDTVEVGDRPVRDLVWSLYDGGAVEGALEFAGSATPMEAAALREVRVSLRPLDPLFRTPAASPSASPGDDRRFRIAGVPPGRYLVRVSLPPNSPWRLRSVMAGATDVTDRPLNAAGSLAGMRVVLTDAPATVTGRAQLGSPGEQAVGVALFPADEALWPDARSLSARCQYRRVSADGTFAFAGVPEGTYFVAAVDDGEADGWPDVSWLRRLARVATPVTVAAGRPASALSLTVLAVPR
jgi:hypothetical protein